MVKEITVDPNADRQRSLYSNKPRVQQNSNKNFKFTKRKAQKKMQDQKTQTYVRDDNKLEHVKGAGELYILGEFMSRVTTGERLKGNRCALRLSEETKKAEDV